jgi:hypothetical protein
MNSISSIPVVRFPFRANTIVVKVEFYDDEHVWSLWIERGISRHGIRLAKWTKPQSYALTVAYLPIHDEALLAVWDIGEEPKPLAEQLVDMLVTLALEKPSEDCINFLQWRLCEAIHDLRRRSQASVDRAYPVVAGA